MRELDIQGAQAYTLSYMTGAYLAALKGLGPSVTAMTDRVIACAGIAVEGFGSATLWAFISAEAGPHMVRLDRCARRLLGMVNLRRVQATTTFVQGQRWLELLGFEYEGTMRKYGPAGEDHLLYARTR